MILVIDDEKREMDSYVQELQLVGYEVRFEKDVDLALGFFEEHGAEVDLLVLDIMMPSGSRFKEVDTSRGLRTGLLVYEWLRERAPDLPCLILTNVSKEDVADRFRTEEMCWFLLKEDYMPFELAEKVASILPRPGGRE